MRPLCPLWIGCRWWTLIFVRKSYLMNFNFFNLIFFSHYFFFKRTINRVFRYLLVAVEIFCEIGKRRNLLVVRNQIYPKQIKGKKDKFNCECNEFSQLLFIRTIRFFNVIQKTAVDSETNGVVSPHPAGSSINSAICKEISKFCPNVSQSECWFSCLLSTNIKVF